MPACVPLFIATATSAWASAGASLVPSPVMATSRPPAWYSRISLSLASGVAWARKSSTPASAAMAAAVSGLSPVIITVLMPIRRSWANRSFIPPLTISFRWITPSASPLRATTSGVPPVRAISSTTGFRSCGKGQPKPWMYVIMASGAPLRMLVPSRFTPLMRVCAVKGMKCAPDGASGPTPTARPRRPYCSFASTTMLRPSGVSSANDASCAASANARGSVWFTEMKATAWRLPSVIVPVLSSNSTSTSPAASTARPDNAITLRRISRSMPAMPMAGSSPPMVVGIRQISSATSTVTVMGAPRPVAATL